MCSYGEGYYKLLRYGLHIFWLTLLGLGGVFRTRIARRAIFDPLRVRIERRYFLTIPKYTIILMVKIRQDI